MTPMQSLRPTQTLEDALAEFRELLSNEQKAQLQALTSTTPGPPGPEAVLLFTAQVDSHNARRKSRCVASRISSFLEAVQQFTAVVDTFVSSHPTVAALVWGGMKVFILAASNFSTFFDELTTCFMNVQRLCPRYAQYEFLYKNSLPLQQSLCTFYASLIRFCTRSMSALQRQGYLQVAKSLFTPFQSDFGALKKEMETNSEDVEKWIRYAADRAADQERQQVQKWRTTFHVFSEKDKEFKISQDRRKRKSRNARLLDRLSDFDYRNALKRLRKKRFQNPDGLWIAKMPQYQEWLHKSRSSVLILSGKMGAGKSVLSAAVTDEILLQQLPPDCLRTFFFCEYDNARTLTTRTILGSLARQCIPPGDLPAELETSLCALFEDNEPDYDDLNRFLVEQCEIARTHFIVVDGLDECSGSDRELLLSTFKALLKLDKPNFKFFLSGRDDIRTEFHRELHPEYQLSMNCPEVSDDIEVVIDASLDEKQKKRKLVLQDPELIHRIRSALKAGAHGMFLWVDLMIEDLCVQVCDDDMRDTIDHLPTTLAEVFERALLRVVKGGHSDIACKMFGWAAVARRPLSLEEMREAISIEPCQSSLNVGKLVTTIDRMMSWSGNLLILDEEENLVHFAHHSVREYLQSSPKYQTFQKFHINLSNAHRSAGEVCVTYLSFTAFEQQLNTFVTPSSHIKPLFMAKMSLPGGTNSVVNKSWTRLEKLVGGRSKPSAVLLDQFRAVNINNERLHWSRSLQTTFCFLAYASEHWLDHTTNFTEESCSSYDLWRNLVFSDKSHVTKPWTTEQWENGDICLLRFIVDSQHDALLSLVTDLEMKRTGVSPGSLSDDDKKYLLDASSRLWNGEVEKDEISEKSETGPLLWRDDVVARTRLDNLSSLKEDDILARVFPKHTAPEATIGIASTGSNTTSPDVRYPAPKARIIKVCIHFALLAAAVSGDEDRVRTYLKLHAIALPLLSEDRPLPTLFTLLDVAASTGQMNVVKLIVAHPSFCSMLENSDGLALLLAFNVASFHGNSKIVSQVANRAYLQWREVSKSPSIIATGDNLTVMALAHLRGGADVDLPSRLRLISDTIARSPRGTPRKLIAYILARAAVEIKDSEGNTALHYLWAFPQLVGPLVHVWADLEARNEHGRTPLCQAAFNGKADLSKNLIDHGADVGATDNDGHSVLHLIVLSGLLVEDIVKMLIDHGANVNAIDNEGRTALHYAATGSDSRVLKSLAEAGANVNAVDNNGWSALHLTITSIELDVNDIVRTLIDLGADVNAIDNQGRSVLHHAIIRETFSYVCNVVKLLIDHGADVHAIDNEGLSTVHHAVNGYRISVLETLAERGANVNAVDNKGLTPLHHAAKCESISVLETLVERGVNVNAVDKKGLTPLHHLLDQENFRHTAPTVLTYRSSSCIRLLLSKRADPDIVDSDDRTVRRLLGDKSKMFITT